jgi:adenylate cyclase
MGSGSERVADPRVRDEPSERRSTRRRQPAAARAAVRGVILIQALANSAGALVVFAYLYWLFPVELPDAEAEQSINITVFGLYLFVTMVLAAPINGLNLRRAMSWVREGREPTPAERKETLTQPLWQTASAFCGWLGAAVIFGILNENSARVSVGIVLAGLVTCSILYLMLERHFRPIFALALEGAELPENRREILPRLMLAWWLGSAIPLLAVAVAPMTAPDDTELSRGWEVSLLVVTCLAGGGLIMRGAAGSVAGPINMVRRAMRRVEAGDLDVRLPVDNLGEIGRLEAGFNSMVHDLRERAELFDLLDQQVGPEVARRSLQQKPSLGGGRRVVTVLFVDLHGYTAYSESHTPEEVVDMLNRFFGVVVRVVQQEGGHVNKFEGDAALCVFGAPDDQPDHAERALRAAANLPLAVGQLPDDPDAGVGVSTGEAVAGYVGTEHRYEYTVIGDVVNVASRLCDLAKTRPGRVLAAAETVAAAGRGLGVETWRSGGSVQLRGRSTPTPVFEPVAVDTGKQTAGTYPATLR